MIAVTFALPSESGAFVNKLIAGKRTNGFIAGEYAGDRILVVHTGVGAESARARLSTLLEREQPAVLISSGFAGGLGDSLEPGDLLLGRNVSSEGLCGAAANALPQAKIGDIVTGDTIVHTATARAELARTSGAQAVDMESEAIGEICAAHAIQMLSLRAISDTPSSPFPAPPDVLFDVERQRTDPLRLFLYLLARPFAVGRLVTFARQINNTRNILADALCQLISSGTLR
jgi:adenosylhomocysteine nucleosidase